MNRYELIETVVPVLKDTLVVCNIGIPSQELFSICDRENHFYMLGSMGLCSSIGLGLALTTNKSVVALEGDGALLMNLGTLATIGNRAPDNLILLVPPINYSFKKSFWLSTMAVTGRPETRRPIPMRRLPWRPWPVVVGVRA